MSATGGAAKAIEVPDRLDIEKIFEELESKLALLALNRSDPSATVRSRMCIALRELLSEHPFVRSETTVSEQEVHRFEQVGFTIDMRKFRDWLKSEEGKLYKKLTGTGVDDTVYLISNLLRTYLPRGLHIVTATNKETNAETVFVFRGIPKFSGMTATDEDEESSASAGAFFFDGRTIEDVKTAYVTEKSNGENAKLSLIRIDDLLYAIAGSKTTCAIWPADRDYFEFYPLKEGERPEGNYPVQTICKIYSEWLRGLSTEQLRSFEDEFAKHGYMATIIAELNREWEQHIVKNKSTYLSFVSFLGPDGNSINPETAFSFFESIGVTESDTDPVRHVSMYRVDIDSSVMLMVVDKIRRDTGREGAVLYLFDGENNLVGLVKVKTTWYITLRRLRELFRGFLTSLTGGVCKGIGHIPTRHKKNPDSKPWQTKKFSDLVTAVTKKIKNECGEFGQTFVTYMLKRLEGELGGRSIADCIADQQTIPFPAKDAVCEMTPLMDAVKKLNMEFNASFPQLVENCSA